MLTQRSPGSKQWPRSAAIPQVGTEVLKVAEFASVWGVGQIRGGFFRGQRRGFSAAGGDSVCGEVRRCDPDVPGLGVTLTAERASEVSPDVAMQLRAAVHHDTVRPGEASMFGRSQSCRKRDQTPVAWMTAQLPARTFCTFVREFSPLVCVLTMSTVRHENHRHRNVRIRVSSRWRRIKVTAFDRAQLEAIRKEQVEAFAARHRPPEKSPRETVNRSPRHRISSKTVT